ncbi:MAG TPA: hypothetical protein VII01_14575 [Solirubrobacteraceae bacterium]|jgi:hypothetical protein
MDTASPGDLVTLADGGSDLDGIVFDTPSRTKVVVAVVDRTRGPVFRTVHPRTLSERAEEGASDRVLNQLIRRTPVPGRHGAGGSSASREGRAGHSRAAMHRTTGK